MAPLDDTTPETRFDSFNIHRTSYKKVDKQDIEVGILVPKDLNPGPHAIIVKFHGGGLVRYSPFSTFTIRLYANMDRLQATVSTPHGSVLSSSH